MRYKSMRPHAMILGILLVHLLTTFITNASMFYALYAGITFWIALAVLDLSRIAQNEQGKKLKKIGAAN